MSLPSPADAESKCPLISLRTNIQFANIQGTQSHNLYRESAFPCCRFFPHPVRSPFDTVRTWSRTDESLNCTVITRPCCARRYTQLHAIHRDPSFTIHSVLLHHCSRATSVARDSWCQHASSGDQRLQSSWRFPQAPPCSRVFPRSPIALRMDGTRHCRYVRVDERSQP